MLRRTVTGFRALRSTGSRTARSKLYHADQVRLPEHALPYTDFYTHRAQASAPLVHRTPPRTDPLSQLESILSREEPQWAQPAVEKKRHGGSLANETLIRELPQRLRTALRKSSDHHIRLETLLMFKDSLRVYCRTLEDFVRKEFGVEDVKELYTRGLIGQDLIIKLMKYQIAHRNYDEIADMYHHTLFNSFNDLRLLQKLNDTLFTTLREDHDLQLGFTDIMKRIYTKLNNDVKLFKMVFTSITNNGQTLTKLGFKQPMFLDTLRAVQLESFVRTCSDVQILPKEYRQTSFDYVNLSLALRLVEDGKPREGLLHLESTGVLSQPGVFYRFVHQALSKSPLTKSEISRVVQSFFKRVPNVQFGAIDKSIWGKVTSAQNYHSKTIDRVEDITLKNELRSIYLKKLLKQKRLGLAKATMSKIVSESNSIDIPTMVTLVSLTKEAQLLRQIAMTLTPLRRSMFFDMMYLNHCSKVASSQEVISPEAQLSDMKWLLKGFKYKLTNGNMINLNRYLISLPEKCRVSLLKKIHGPTCVSYLELVRGCKSVETALMLLKKGSFRTRDELKSLSLVISGSFSTGQMIDLLRQLQSENKRLYHSLHQKITLGLICNKKFDRAHKIMDQCVDAKSKALLNDALLLKDPQNVDALIQNVSNTPQEQLQLRTFKKLMDPTHSGMPLKLSRDLKRVFTRSKLKNKATSVMLVKHTIDRIKKQHDGYVVATDRLRWALSQCARYKVPKSVISGLIDQ